MKKNIYLVRHAQSESNVDFNVLKGKTNVGISLTEQGKKQIKETSILLSEHLLKNSPQNHFITKVWNSPYERTRLTANQVKETFTAHNVEFVAEESIYLAERQFGIVDDSQDYEGNHNDAYNHYQLHSKEKKEFFVRPMLGESPFDMCIRLDFFIRTVLANDTNVNHVIVSHGAAIRGFLMMHQKWEYESYTKMPNPYNASIHYIENNEYKGELFSPTERTK